METPHLTFRPVGKDEYALAEHFKRETFLANTGSYEQFEAMFTASNPYSAQVSRLQEFDAAAVAFAALKDDVIGYVELGTRRDDPARGFIFNLYLQPEWRGRKLGDQLEAYALQWCRTHGFQQVRLRTTANNSKAMAFYHRLGYVWDEDSRDGLVFLAKQVPAV